MRIYHGALGGRIDVAVESATEVSLETALAVFDALTSRTGFLGVILEWHRQVRFYHDGRRVRVELVDASAGTADSCNVDPAFARSLIYAAAAGRNTFAIARAGVPGWTRQPLEVNPPASGSPPSPTLGENPPRSRPS